MSTIAPTDQPTAHHRRRRENPTLVQLKRTVQKHSPTRHHQHHIEEAGITTAHMTAKTASGSHHCRPQSCTCHKDKPTMHEAQTITASQSHEEAPIPHSWHTSTMTEANVSHRITLRKHYRQSRARADHSSMKPTSSTVRKANAAPTDSPSMPGQASTRGSMITSSRSNTRNSTPTTKKRAWITASKDSRARKPHSYRST